jgi:hypothetical protein
MTYEKSLSLEVIAAHVTSRFPSPAPTFVEVVYLFALTNHEKKKIVPELRSSGPLRSE